MSHLKLLYLASFLSIYNFSILVFKGVGSKPGEAAHCRYKIWDAYGRLLFNSAPLDHVVTSIVATSDLLQCSFVSFWVVLQQTSKNLLQWCPFWCTFLSREIDSWKHDTSSSSGLVPHRCETMGVVAGGSRKIRWFTLAHDWQKHGELFRGLTCLLLLVNVLESQICFCHFHLHRPAFRRWKLQCHFHRYDWQSAQVSIGSPAA